MGAGNGVCLFLFWRAGSPSIPSWLKIRWRSRGSRRIYCQPRPVHVQRFGWGWPSDADETNNIGTDPNDSDSDNDGALDGLDIDPISSERSGIDNNLDGIDDAWANTFYANGVNATDDLDADGLTVLQEYVSDTSDANFNHGDYSAPELRLRSNRVTRIPPTRPATAPKTRPALGLDSLSHADSALVKFEAASVYLNGLIEINNVWAPDTFNLDGNFFTDHHIEISWPTKRMVGPTKHSQSPWQSTGRTPIHWPAAMPRSTSHQARWQSYGFLPHH